MAAEPVLLIASKAERIIRSQEPRGREQLAEELQQAFMSPEEIESRTTSDEPIPGLEGDYRTLILRGSGYAVIYRRLTPDELRRQGRGVDVGYYILDLIPLSAYFNSPRPSAG